MPWIQDTHPEKDQMPTFNDSNNIPPLLPEGDYIFCVVGFDSKLSQGNKTRGSDVFELELEIEPSGKKVFENLIDHPACSWKLDVFLKSAGVQLAKGESFEFRRDMAAQLDIRHVNPYGLRGWCRLGTKELPTKDGRKPLVVNEVVVFYTDKPKLPPRQVAPPEEESADKPF